MRSATRPTGGPAHCLHWSSSVSFFLTYSMTSYTDKLTPSLSSISCAGFDFLRALRVSVVQAFGVVLRLRPIRAIRLDTVRIDLQRMLVDREAVVFRDLGLPFFDFGVVKLLDATALEAHQVVVVFALVQL